MLYDSSKFKDVDIKPRTETKFLLQEGDELTAFLEYVKNLNKPHKALYIEVLNQILNITHDLSKILNHSCISLLITTYISL